jgi:ABC-type sugar transport system substrate-binding protein
MAAMKLRMPNSSAYLVAAVSPDDPDPEARCRELIDAAVASNLDGIDLAAVESVVTAAVVGYAKGRGLVVGVWVTGSLDVESGWRAFAERDVDYITTNLPPEVYEVFERRPQR